jgi:hypothetical protein
MFFVGPSGASPMTQRCTEADAAQRFFQQIENLSAGGRMLGRR